MDKLNHNGEGGDWRGGVALFCFLLYNTIADQVFSSA